MLIPLNNLNIKKTVKGVLHIGAHECEERDSYLSVFKLKDSDIIWIDALEEKVQEMKNSNPNIIIYNECIGDLDNQSVTFTITNNYQSSSILKLKTHLKEHPHVHQVSSRNMKTKTINTLFKENNLNITKYNFINLDIQGAELLALKGSTDILPYVDYIYCEVNIDELYENCAIMQQIDMFLNKYKFKRIRTEMTKHGWGDAFYIRMS